MLYSSTKPYYSFSQYLQQRYGEKVWKISVDAGFSCPNRDGHKGRDGCIFCRVDSFSKMDSLRGIDVASQVRKGIAIGRQKLGIRKYIVYFQASTNTYAPIEVLQERYESAIAFPEVVGLSISTRPDCLPDQVLQLLEMLSHRLDMWVELGLQSSHDETLKRINRGHSFADYTAAIERLERLNVRKCTHIMLGLPGEERRHIHQTADLMAQLPIEEIKVHPLLILKDTILENMYRADEFKVLELKEYAELVCDFIEKMPPGLVVQRLTAEAPVHMLIEPLWALDKHIVLREIQQEFKRRDSYQGKKYHQKTAS